MSPWQLQLTHFTDGWANLKLGAGVMRMGPTFLLCLGSSPPRAHSVRFAEAWLVFQAAPTENLSSGDFGSGLRRHPTSAELHALQSASRTVTPAARPPRRPV